MQLQVLLSPYLLASRRNRIRWMPPPFQREEIRKISWDGRASTVRQHCLLLTVLSPASVLFVLGMVRKARLFLQRIRHLKQGRMTPRCPFCTRKGTVCSAPQRMGLVPSKHCMCKRSRSGSWCLHTLSLGTRYSESYESSVWFRSKDAEARS